MRGLNRNAPHIIGLVGYMRSGKDSVADCLQTLALGNYVRVSFAYPVYKIVATLLGEQVSVVERLKDQVVPWLGVTRRHLLQTIGTQWGRHLVNDEIWIRYAMRSAARLHAKGQNVVITDVRFPNEVQAIQEFGHRNNTLWRVTREVTMSKFARPTHESESYIESLPVDYTIVNNGTLQDLERLTETAWCDTFR